MPNTHHYHSSQVSADLLWEVIRNNNSYLVKRKTGGGLQFSRDPFNVMNKHSRKHSGLVNDKAVGVIPAEGEKGGVTLITKKTNHVQRPANNTHNVTFGGNKSSRKSYQGIANTVAKSNYRGDLRSGAVARASAIRKSQQPKKEDPKKKLRGAKAKKAAAAEKET